MKILFVHANNDDIGGADFCLFKLIYELHVGNYEIEPMIVLSKSTEIVNLYSQYNIPYAIIPMTRIQKRISLFYYVQLLLNFFPTLKKLKNIINDNQIDIVFSNDLMDIYGGIASRMAGVKGIQYIRMILPKKTITRTILTKLSLKFNNRILVVSKSVGRYMFWEKKISKINPKVMVCNDWIDMKLVGHENGKENIRNELNLESKIVITSVSRLEPWKGQKILIQAIPEVIKVFKDVAFLLVGGIVKGRKREAYGEALKQIAKSNGSDEFIHFLGERKDVKTILENSDIFVHSPISPDPFPGVVLESMASSKVVIGSNDGGIPEEIEEGETGLLFEAGNSHDLAKKIMYLLSNRKLIVEMGDMGYKRVHNNFVKEKIVPQMVNILNNTLNEIN
jgi:glycosyltransferase involved in cell wall biosynthesis